MNKNNYIVNHVYYYSYIEAAEAVKQWAADYRRRDYVKELSDYSELSGYIHMYRDRVAIGTYEVPIGAIRRMLAIIDIYIDNTDVYVGFSYRRPSQMTHCAKVEDAAAAIITAKKTCKTDKIGKYVRKQSGWNYGTYTELIGHCIDSEGYESTVYAHDDRGIYHVDCRDGKIVDIERDNDWHLRFYEDVDIVEQVYAFGWGTPTQKQEKIKQLHELLFDSEDQDERANLEKAIRSLNACQYPTGVLVLYGHSFNHSSMFSSFDSSSIEEMENIYSYFCVDFHFCKKDELVGLLPDCSEELNEAAGWYVLLVDDEPVAACPRYADIDNMIYQYIDARSLQKSCKLVKAYSFEY